MSVVDRERWLPAALVGVTATGTGYVVAGGGNVGLAAIGGMAVVFAVAIRARTALLVAAVASLIAGSSAIPTVKADAFFVRFILLAALVAVTLLERPGRAAHWDRLDRFLVALVAWAMVSTLWSVAPGLSAARSVGLALMAAVVLSAAHRAWSTEERLVRDVATGATIMVVALIGGLTLLLARLELTQFSGRFRGIMENPNTAGLMAGLVLPLAVGLAIARPGVRRLWWLAAAAVATATLVLSQSRGGFISGAVGVLVVVVLSDPGRRTPFRVITWCLIAVALVIAIPGNAPTPPAVESFVLRFQDRTGSGRLDAWDLSIELYGERPLGGWGFGTAELVFGPRAASLAGWRGELVPSAYLQALLELGLVGFTFLVVLVAGVLVRAWPGRRSSPLQAAIYGALVAGSIYAFIESGMLSAGSVFALNYWLIALAAVRSRSLADQGTERIATGSRP